MAVIASRGESVLGEQCGYPLDTIQGVVRSCRWELAAQWCNVWRRFVQLAAARGASSQSWRERGGCGGDLDQVILRLEIHPYSSSCGEGPICLEVQINKSLVPSGGWLLDTGCDTCVSDKEVDEEDRAAAAGQCCHSAADSFSAVNVIAAPGQRITVTFESKPWSIFRKTELDHQLVGCRVHCTGPSWFYREKAQKRRKIFHKRKKSKCSGIALRCVALW